MAGADSCVCWQGRAGVTQHTLAGLFMLFYVSPRRPMNVAIQRRMRGRVGGLVKVGCFALPVSDPSDRGGWFGVCVERGERLTSLLPVLRRVVVAVPSVK